MKKRCQILCHLHVVDSGQCYPEVPLVVARAQLVHFSSMTVKDMANYKPKSKPPSHRRHSKDLPIEWKDDVLDMEKN